MAERRCLSLVLHDVAPATWPYYAGFVRQLEALGSIPLTLLVVPDFHAQGPLDRYPDFVRLLQAGVSRGDELVLHGYYHHDPGPIAPSPRDFLMRRILTHEGEFFPLSCDAARHRLARGLDLMQRLDLPVRGFVPPAWLLGSDARKVITEFPFRYTSTPSKLISLPGFRQFDAPSLVWSARSGWRRLLSKGWNRALLWRHANAPFLRLGLHPVDMQYPQVRRYWLDTLEHLLRDRRPVTKSQWLDEQAT